VAAGVGTWGRDTRMIDAEIIAALERINRDTRQLLRAFLMRGGDDFMALARVILDQHSDGPAASGIAALTELLDTDPGAREHVAEIIQEIDPVARYYKILNALMSDESDGLPDLRKLLETLDPKTRDALRRVLIHDQADRDSVSSQLLRYRDGHGDDWADIIDMLTMHPDARRRVVRVLAEIEAEIERPGV
jgi:hypothetical protein